MLEPGKPFSNLGTQETLEIISTLSGYMKLLASQNPNRWHEQNSTLNYQMSGIVSLLEDTAKDYKFGGNTTIKALGFTPIPYEPALSLQAEV